MKKTIKIIIILFLTSLALLLIPKSSNAATRSVTNEESLISEISSADYGDTISIENNITVSKPIVIAKELIIDGNGYTITGSSNWTSTSGNQTMFTAQFSAAKLTLKDIHLVKGPKYGVQAYDGATVILDNVSITDFNYGGVLVNGGNVEVKNLHLGYNGTGANNGIEIDKGAAATNNPSLLMNGVLKTDTNENVVRVAENGSLTEFTVTNSTSTTNKIVLAGNKVVLTDAQDNVISETSIPDKATANADTQKLVISLIYNNQTNKIVIDKGQMITEDILKSHITIGENYQIDGYFTDEQYTKTFNFDESVNNDTTIYVKILEKALTIQEEKDETPKTGVQSYLEIAVVTLVFSVVGYVYMRRKSN